MAFSSISFLFYFLPLFFLVYWLVPARWKNAILAAGSLFFYAWGDLRSVPLLALSILVTYALGRAMRPDAPARRKKLVLILGLFSILRCWSPSNMRTSSLARSCLCRSWRSRSAFRSIPSTP